MYESMAVRQKLGYLPESVPLYPEMRVDEYLTTRAKLKKVDRTIRTARIDYCLSRCRIKEVRHRQIGTLSKGYRQRVGLADALLSDPPVLILDEPLSGLDPIQQEETLASIRDLGGQHTVLFSSHQLTDVEKICDRVIVIHRGRLEFDDRLSTIAKRAASILMEVKVKADEASRLFGMVDGVTGVNATPGGDGWTTLDVKVGHEKDVRETLVRKASEKGWGIRRVELRREKLEDTFMRVAYQRG
jgi:ABC-2 type transport system ATP-binding protein